MASPGLGSYRRFRGNPEERVMSLQGREVLRKREGGVAVREGFLEEVPPEVDLEIRLGTYQGEKASKAECSVCGLKAPQGRNLMFYSLPHF